MPLENERLSPDLGRVVVIAGPPGASEVGLQRARIRQRCGLVPISVGHLLSEHVQHCTEFGANAKEYIDRHERVPSELVVSILKDRLSKLDVLQRGCLLEGFPLTIDHAEAMEGHIEVDQFLVIEVPDQTVIQSFVKQPSSRGTGIRYHSHSSLASRSAQADNDIDEKVRARLEAYHASMSDVVSHFKDKVRIIHGAQDIDTVFSAISTCLAQVPRSVPNVKNCDIVVVVGPPASGKGTYCERVVKQYGFVPVSAGSLLEQHMRRGTALGAKAKDYKDKQERVPSELLVSILRERMSKPDVLRRGCLLDGFPLSAEHAEAMKGQIELDHFLVIVVPDETLVERCVNRRLDPLTGAIYNLKLKSPPAEVASRLVQNDGDTDEKVRTRLEAYHASLNGILPYFGDKVKNIDGTQHPDQVFDEIATSLGKTPIPLPNMRKGFVVAIVAPPAAWQEAQYERIANKLDFVCISIGKLLLNQIQLGNEWGIMAKEYLDRQEQVPSELIVGLLRVRIGKSDAQQRGCLLIDFPLSHEHVKAMMGHVEIDQFLVAEVPDETIVERCVNRRLDPETGATYNLKFKPPPPETSSRLIQTNADTDEEVRARLEAYHTSMVEMLPHFEGKVHKVSGAQHFDATFSAIRRAIVERLRETARQDDAC